jgi:4'-phosphopantetheinyl transferase
MAKLFDAVATPLDVAPELVRAATALLSPSERERASRFAFERDGRRFIVARATLRRLLAARLDVQPEEIELVNGPHGKPALADSDLHFNVSHCDDLAVYAFSWRHEIGIDVEAVRWFVDAEDVAARFFSRRENIAYAALDPLDRPLGFFNCWTRKEAFIKALGDGLDHPLDSFDVSLAPNEPPRILRVENTPGEHCGWSVESFVPMPGFVAAVVTENHD